MENKILSQLFGINYITEQTIKTYDASNYKHLYHGHGNCIINKYECNRVWSSLNKDKMREYVIKFRTNNPDKVKEYSKKYYNANKKLNKN
jgi:hypothetical protein